MRQRPGSQQAELATRAVLLSAVLIERTAEVLFAERVAHTEHAQEHPAFARRCHDGEQAVIEMFTAQLPERFQRLAPFSPLETQIVVTVDGNAAMLENCLIGRTVHNEGDIGIRQSRPHGAYERQRADAVTEAVLHFNQNFRLLHRALPP